MIPPLCVQQEALKINFDVNAWVVFVNHVAGWLDTAQNLILSSRMLSLQLITGARGSFLKHAE